LRLSQNRARKQPDSRDFLRHQARQAAGAQLIGFGTGSDGSFFSSSFLIKLMEESMKLFAKKSETRQPSSGFELIPNKKYRLTRQMYLFPKQEVTPQINDYLKIGAVVTYLKSGTLVEDQNLSMPWVYVRSEKHRKADMGKGREGWCFSHYLEMVEDDGGPSN
jgi:hypothetical protein